jgi:hypothetical protein
MGVIQPELGSSDLVSLVCESQSSGDGKIAPCQAWGGALEASWQLLSHFSNCDIFPTYLDIVPIGLLIDLLAPQNTGHAMAVSSLDDDTFCVEDMSWKN